MNNIKHLILILTIALYACPATAGALLIQGGRLWDGRGGPAQAGVDVLVQDGRIAAVGAGIEAPEGAAVFDAAGATVLPGLIDTHVHLSLAPGQAWRDDSAAEREALLRAHMAAYLAVGVTTVLDPGVLWEDAAQIRGLLASGAPGPRYLHCGPVIGPVGGYVSAPIPTFPAYGSRADIEAHLDRAVAEGADCVKMTIEEGFVGKVWPLLSPDLRAAVVEGAAARGLPLYIHAMSREEQELALDLRPRGLVHAGQSRSRAFAARLAEERVWVESTLYVTEGMRVGFHPRQVDRQRGLELVPEAELATARDRALSRQSRRAVGAQMFPRAPGFSRGLLDLGMRLGIRTELRGLQGTVRRLHAAGVRLVLGSDAGNWPVFTSLFHGVGTIREAELLAQSGFRPEEVLSAATRLPAEMLGLEGEIGTVEVGKAGDLVIVDGDPLADVSALWDVRATVRGGEVVFVR